MEIIKKFIDLSYYTESYNKVHNESKIREKLSTVQSVVDDCNKELSKIDHQIKSLKAKKVKIAKRISHNMRYRNKLINNLYYATTI